MKRCVLAIAAMFSIVFVPAHAQEQTVTAKEIQDTWVGKTLVGTTANGAPATLKLRTDGGASVSAGATNDTGIWRLSDQGYCTTWRNIRSGQERCFIVRRADTKMTVFNPDGSVRGDSSRRSNSQLSRNCTTPTPQSQRADSIPPCRSDDESHVCNLCVHHIAV